MSMCNTCYGDGYIITCCDDICVGSNRCMHGDGEEICPECNGEGEIWDNELLDNGARKVEQ